uniref:Putative secreted protein n=1 Tax=Ixodes ricinus TaxID=34613 RepID=A0A6B0TWC1_IXORI
MMLSMLPAGDGSFLVRTYTLLWFLMTKTLGYCCRKSFSDLTEQPYLVRRSGGSWDRWPVSFCSEMP